MSIFGSEAPKFVYDEGGFNEEIVLLDNARFEPDYIRNRDEMQESILTLHRNWIRRGHHTELKVLLHFYKADDAAAIFRQVYKYLGTDVTLYAHRDGAGFRKASGENVLFHVNDISHFYLNTTDYKDAMKITFVSNDVVDLAATLDNKPNEPAADSGGYGTGYGNYYGEGL